MKKAVLKHFAIFTGKHPCWNLFLIKLQTKAYNFIKNETPAQVFSYECCEIFKNTDFEEHLRTADSAYTPISSHNSSKKSIYNPPNMSI